MLCGDDGISAWRDRSRLLRVESRRERFHVPDNRLNVIVRQQLLPGGHRGCVQSLTNRSEQIVVGRDAAAFSRANLVAASREVARARDHEMRRRTIALAIASVTLDTMFVV